MTPPLDTILDTRLQDAIVGSKTPGAVLFAGHNDVPLYRNAFGHRRVTPHPLPMQATTIFDLASLTKVVATAPAISLLIDRGKIGLDDPVYKFLPAFRGGYKSQVTIRHIVTHTGGIRALTALLPGAPRKRTPNAVPRAITKICELRLQSKPGTKFTYSDLGYILLAHLVEIVSGDPFDVFCQQHLFEPLGLSHTRFKPPRKWRDTIAATEWRNERMLCGAVHDPNAFALGGIAGHAGLFSNAPDLVRFCQMILSGGKLDGVRILSERAVELMTTNQCHVKGIQRGLGFDIDSPYSHPRGHFFSRSSFGHTGFTGTSLWMDPASGTHIILLTNRLHPDGAGDVRELRMEVANILGKVICEQT